MSCRFKEISLANWPRIVQSAKLLHYHHLVYRHLKRREGVCIYIVYTSFLFETPGFWSLDLSSLIAHPCDHILCCLKEGWGWETLLQFVLLVRVCLWWEMWHGTVTSWLAVFLEHCSMFQLAAELGEIHCSLSLPGIIHSLCCAVGKWWLMLSCLPPCQEKPFVRKNHLQYSVSPCCSAMKMLWTKSLLLCGAEQPVLGWAQHHFQVPQRAVQGWCGNSVLEIQCLSHALDFHLPLVEQFCAKWLMGSGHSRLTSLYHLLLHDTEPCCICLTSSF